MDAVLVKDRDVLATRRRFGTITRKHKWPIASVFSSKWAQVRTRLVDATRITDGKLVYIKQVDTNDRESRIALMLGSYEDPTNHSVPILDTFADPSDESISYVVMPFLRIWEEPAFFMVGEILDFADQLLEVSAVPWLSVYTYADTASSTGPRIHALKRCCT